MIFKYKKTKTIALFPVSHIILILYRSMLKNASSAFARNNFWELYYVDRGDRYVKSDGKTYYLKPGQGIFFPPNSEHASSICTGQSSNIVNISFICPLLDKEFFGNKVFTFNSQEKKIITDLVEEGLLCFVRCDDSHSKGMLLRKDTPPYVVPFIKSSIEQLLLLLYRKEAFSNRSNYALGENRQNQVTLLIQYAVDYMHSNIYNNLSLSDIANEINISSSYLRALFKKEIGKSVMEYYNDIKIENAKILIREDTYNFAEIAEKLGYNSASHFSSQFKKKVNMTPSEYSKLVNPNLYIQERIP